jgi:ribosomal protein S18 acetylase RimI-like enzyme
MLTQKAEVPEIQEFQQLHLDCGLSAKPAEAAALGLPNSLFATTVRIGDRLVAMGRVVGDGGCNFEVVDIAVHPEFQRQGIAQIMMDAIMKYLQDAVPKSAYVSLIADRHSPALYSKFGFKPTAPASIGMALKIPKPSKP